MLLGNLFPNNSFYGFVAFSSVTLWWMARVCQGVPVLLVVSVILWGEWNINRGSFILLGNDGIKGRYIFADQIFSAILASMFLYEPVESFAELLPHHGVEMGKLSPEQCHFTFQAFQDFSNLSVWLFLSKSAFAVFSLSASSSLRMLMTFEKSFIVREWFRWDLCFTVKIENIHIWSKTFAPLWRFVSFWSSFSARLRWFSARSTDLDWLPWCCWQSWSLKWWCLGRWL